MEGVTRAKNQGKKMKDTECKTVGRGKPQTTKWRKAEGHTG